MRWDHYDYYGQLLAASGNIPALDDANYFSYHASADLNTENDWYFPSRGTRFHAAYAYRTTNLYNLDGEMGLSDITVHWRINLPLSHNWSLQPMLYTRLLLKDEIPLAFSNFVGGNNFGLIVEQQLPLSGVGHLELTDRHLVDTKNMQIIR